AHGSVKNRLPERSEAFNEIADDRAETARLDYLALGDWHGTLEIAPHTWYAGTPEPDRFRNNQPGNLLEVTLPEPGATPTVEIITCGHFCWTLLEIALYAGSDIDALEQQLAALSNPAQQIVRLRLSGSVDLASRSRLNELFNHWQARFHHLECQDEALHSQPSDNDLEQLATQGFVTQAFERLRQLATQPNDPQSTTAQRALQILYQQQQKLEQSK
ncbi:MAG: DNA repair exonuclease, partial [Chromatiales bacterium]|nr:DNA repair exonuclease [Chromatiales bacterium]